jgi:hypothetical protein
MKYLCFGRHGSYVKYKKKEAQHHKIFPVEQQDADCDNVTILCVGYMVRSCTKLMKNYHREFFKENVIMHG